MNRMRYVVLSLLVLFAPSAAAVAAEAAAEPVWYGNVQLWEAVAGIVVVVWGVIKTRYALKKKWGDETVEFLEMGVQKTYDTFVREAKAKNPKHKLTKEQVTQARDKAFAAAKEFAKAKGIDLAKRVVADRVPVLITGIVNRLKKRK